MRNTLLGLLAAAALFPTAARTAEPSAAQDRTALYQREVRAALARRGWRITRDEAGKLTAERHMANKEGTTEFLIGENVDKRARLEISFRADGKDHTAAAARASLCYYNLASPDTVGQTIYPPFALRDPELTREYRNVLAEADSHLSPDHRAPRTAADSNKVAVK